MTIYSSEGKNKASSFSFGNHSWVGYKSDESGESHMYGTWGHNQGGPKGLRQDTPAEFIYASDATSRSKHISDEQEEKMYQMINDYRKKGENAWGKYSACSSFASNVWESATDEDLQDRHLFGIGYSDPNVLADSIKKENKKVSK